MKTLALRLYGENDLRLERFDLPEITDDESLADIVTNSICMSDYKATIQGGKHKRVPDDVATNPIIIGHEFCGRLLKVGKNWQHKFHVGQKYGVQPQLNLPGAEHKAPGYSFPFIGGEATRIVIPKEVMQQDCLLTYKGDAYYKSSIAEPVSCIIGAYRCTYHFKAGEYVHQMGLKQGGSMVILAGAGPMGLSAIDLALHGPENRPGRLVITDIDQARLDRAEQLFSVADAKAHGVDLVYLNTGKADDPVACIKAANGGKGYDDVFVFAPVPALIEQASALLGFLGCLNFFAGPSKSDFKATMNFYDVHYMGHHVVGSSGGNTKDLQDAMDYAAQGLITPSVMITHVGGLDSVAEATKILPKIPGGKKLIYTHVSMPLTAISDFAELGKTDPFYAGLAEICARNNQLWSSEAESYILKHAPRLEQDAVI
ncbi:MAG: zinc-binding dehydrogenase [Kiritimatiellae bacterium]|nr:zinc-binding dehydrogenase [Kiritimatiellia bacterium]